MSTSSAVINYRDTNNTALQKTVAGVNPNANSNQIVALAQGLIGLTDNTYGSTNRVDRSSCDGKTYYPITTDDPPVSEKTMTLSEFKNEFGGEKIVQMFLTYAGSSTPYAFIQNVADITLNNFCVNVFGSNTKVLRCVCEDDLEEITPCDVIVRVDETDTQSAAEFVLHIVADPEEP